MELDFREEQSYLRAKKRVNEIKAFFIHFLVYILVNIFISGIIVFGLLQSGYSFVQAISNFGVHSTWIFWGIGVFFHWLAVFGFPFLGFGKDWEEKKIKELMNKDDRNKRQILFFLYK